MSTFSECICVSVHAAHTVYCVYRLGALTCGKEMGLLELCVGQRLLVVQNTGIEQGARSVALLKCWSLW